MVYWVANNQDRTLENPIALMPKRRSILPTHRSLGRNRHVPNAIAETNNCARWSSDGRLVLDRDCVLNNDAFILFVAFSENTIRVRHDPAGLAHCSVRN